MNGYGKLDLLLGAEVLAALDVADHQYRLAGYTCRSPVCHGGTE